MHTANAIYNLLKHTVIRTPHTHTRTHTHTHTHTLTDGGPQARQGHAATLQEDREGAAAGGGHGCQVCDGRRAA